MKPSHDVTDFQTNSYRFSGYRFKRDENKSILKDRTHSYEPEYWFTRAISRSTVLRDIPYGKK